MFLVSLFLIVSSSYLFLSAILKKTKLPFFILLLMTIFSQIILSFELLSLFKLITMNNFIITNIVILLFSIILFIKNNQCLYVPEIKSTIKEIKTALKLDKFLAVISVVFIVFLIVQLIAVLFFNITFGDALAYYLPRCTSWIQYHSIVHYQTPDTRELIFPVNSEILYMWFMLFRKTEVGCAVFSYISYISICYIIYQFLKELAFSVRTRLWCVFVFSSFVLTQLQMINPCSDMMIGGLILTSIYLFIYACKRNNNICIYFSALSFALSCGTKTTALIAIPVSIIIFLYILKIYAENHTKNIALKFLLGFFICFLIFSSYNYILNIIHFHNPISCNEQILLNEFRGGFKGWLCNIIKYVFAIFDASGIKNIDFYNGFITYLQSCTFCLIGETDKSYTSPFFERYFLFNSNVSLTSSALGITGLFAFLPSVLRSLKHFNSKREKVLFILSLSLLLNIALFSLLMVFTKYNMRYLYTFVVISLPILLYSYIRNNKKICKVIISFFVVLYLITIPFQAPSSKFFNPKNIKDFQNNSEEIEIYNFLTEKKSQTSNNFKLALIVNQDNYPVYYIEKLKLDGLWIDKLLLENIDSYDLNNYSYILVAGNSVASTNIVNFSDMMRYPDLYSSKCAYYDNKGREIYGINDVKPVMVICEIPFEYFEYKKFIIEKKYRNYTLLKKNW